MTTVQTVKPVERAAKRDSIALLQAWRAAVQQKGLAYVPNPKEPKLQKLKLQQAVNQIKTKKLNGMHKLENSAKDNKCCKNAKTNKIFKHLDNQSLASRCL